jgi:hypothetical protein
MTINLLFSGDFAPLIDPSKIIENHFSALKSILAETDCHITNLECPLTLVEKSINKTGPALKAQPDTIKLLNQARVNVACLANNHIFDYGETALQETIKICEENDIKTIGVVNRPDGKKAWLIKEIKGKKIGFLNYCEHEFSVREEGEFGANGYDPIRCFCDVSTLRSQVNYLIVIYHGGNEYYPLPRPGLKKAFHYLIDLGADAVIGHHPHVISGYEMYKGKPLIYSLGNFIFPYENEPEAWHLGMLCFLAINEKILVELVPFGQCRSELKVDLLAEQDKVKHKINIDNLSKIIMDDSSLRQMWNKFVHEKAKGYLKQIPGVSFFGKVLLKMGFPLIKVFPDFKLLSVINIMRCQSHYDVTIDAMEKQLKK